MIKRILSTLLFLLLLPVVAEAGPVTPERATAVAERFLGGSATKTGGRPLKLVWRGEKPAEAAAPEPAYYVFNAEGGGFVIVSGDDAVTPILAYSHEGSFETAGMPANLEDWMEGLQTCILSARAKGLKPTAEIAQAWRDAGEGAAAPAGAGEVEIETALWGQGEPFNRLCPEVDGGRSVTGCVATAISIIMRHYKYPAAGHGVLPDYSYITNKNHSRTQEGHALGETYQWDRMPLKYSLGVYSDVEAEAVARLMFDVGIMMEMMYNPTGSGAYTHVAGERLVKYMDYDATARMLEKGYFSTEEWMEMVKAEIDAGRPLLYSGYGLEGGHAFVADGYNLDGYIHFNWGWSGRNNGYFAITDVDGFSENNLAVFHLIPNAGSEAQNGVPGYSDISKNGTITRNKTFAVKVDDFVASGTSFTGYVAIGKYNYADELQELISNLSKITNLGVLDYQVKCFACTITTPISPGDYLQLCYTDTLDNPWLPAAFNADYDGNRTIPLVTADTIRENTALHYDRSTRVLTLVSECKGLSCTLTHEDGTDYSYAIQKDASGSTFTVNTKPFPYGNYTLTLTYGSSISVLNLAL